MSALLGEILHRAFPKGEPIRFIQIGGNDGVHMDPLYQYHVDKTFDFEWGQIFEPIPEYFELLTANMAAFPYVTCHNLAVDDSPHPGRREFSYVSHADIEGHGLPPSSKGIGSFSRDRNALGGIGYNDVKFNQIKGYIRTIQVDTVPASDVVEQYADANFLLTDCEGYDVEIISAAFAGNDFRPKVFQFENLGHSEDLLEATLAMLRATGYRVTHSGKDIIGQLA
jgi:FkbM family methyltransferase